MVNRVGRLYPSVIDPRTNNPILFPSGDLVKVPKPDRVAWGRKERGEYISEWYRRDYDSPPGGWNLYDIHHIKPREYGGTNDFENLVPVLRQVHIDEFNAFWRDW